MNKKLRLECISKCPIEKYALWKRIYGQKPPCNIGDLVSKTEDYGFPQTVVANIVPFDSDDVRCRLGAGGSVRTSFWNFQEKRGKKLRSINIQSSAFEDCFGLPLPFGNIYCIPSYQKRVTHLETGKHGSLARDDKGYAGEGQTVFVLWDGRDEVETLPLWEICPGEHDLKRYGSVISDPRFEVINGSQFWKNQNGRIHRDNDLPAIVQADGYQAWYQNGLIHRDNGPAVIWVNGSEGWFRNNKMHRDHDLPAVIQINKKQEWYQNGKRHRDNGPAVIYSNGNQEWYQNGKRHCDNGPAVIYANGEIKYYRHGKQYFPKYASV